MYGRALRHREPQMPMRPAARDLFTGPLATACGRRAQGRRQQRHTPHKVSTTSALPAKHTAGMGHGVCAPTQKELKLERGGMPCGGHFAHHTRRSEFICRSNRWSSQLVQVLLLSLLSLLLLLLIIWGSAIPSVEL